MSQQSKGQLLALIGLVVVLVSALADTLGIGRTPNAFGYKQIAGVVVGLALLVIGWVVSRRGGGKAAG